jgi:pyruvate,water dikinase
MSKINFITMKYIKTFHEVGLSDVHRVGGKNASLGELFQNLAQLDIKVPDGFAITVDGFDAFMMTGSIRAQLTSLLDSIDYQTFSNLQQVSEEAKRLIIELSLPNDVTEEIFSAYSELTLKYGPDTHVAVRSSATAEDLADASFAGQYESYLNIHGKEELLSAVKKCYASLFNARALKYRIDRGFSLEQAQLSVGVQVMIRADLACSGVCFTVDPDTGFRDVVVITGAWGLGDNIVQGKVEPDEFHVFKGSIEAGKKGIIRKKMGTKALTLGYAYVGVGVANRPTPVSKQKSWVLSDDEVETLAKWSMRIEEHYKRAMDIEWAKDGYTKELYIVQARPETVHGRDERLVLREYHLQPKCHPVVEGQAVGIHVAVGRARVLHSLSEASRIEPGDVLVAETTNPDWDVVMKKASAIVTNHGGRTSHAAIVARELGVAAVVGAPNATDLISDGQWITVDCSTGKIGKVYSGKLDFEVVVHQLDTLPKTRTNPMLVLSDPDKAYEWSFYPNGGVGLMRLEFLIASVIQIHPMACVRFDELGSPEERQQINTLTEGYSDKASYFVDRLSQGIATMAAAFYPKDVIVRFSDFKTNEYESLLGGHAFEEHEENPMIGFRGASRYYHERYRDGFALECRAIDWVRRKMGLTNVKVMIPFCRTVRELELVLSEMAKYDLVRGELGLHVYMMIEVPSNVIEAESFAALVDGFSIGSNDLTQLTLGVDRDSAVIASLFDEGDPAVKWMIAHAIDAAHKAKIKVGLCGQAPSDNAAFTEFLVERGIDSISFNPDSIIQGIQKIHDAEVEVELNKTIIA